ncbi:multidrug efflux SMR transporter [Agromyces endophyticus]|uniref:DMT family transporter n=1 Tax=Agromyces sp. H17E-10 TaxID=2932244 RepID=UPI001FD280C8|nr:multidrug efflux SMR transporter [Agromyces sp. H17E-10]UOQ90386.1 multidrug efflux SMR transporter [Agromyces sp. H17E-10]
MSVGWIAVIAAGLLEIAWAHSIRLTEGFTKLVPTIVCGVLTVAVLALLELAMKSVPVGTAYAVFVGIGAIGTALVGMFWLHEPMSLLRGLALALIVGGVVLLRLTDTSASAA